MIKVSYVRPGKIFTANISIVEKIVAQVKPETRQAVIDRITEDFEFLPKEVVLIE